ncbi:MAG: ATPase, P-type (transporting), superfamily, subfamily, partial [Firmicutes bacterium]|nr:ATPase, P-type (transporting), superfamily, subfamily [Bacillota bacterium]
MYKEQNSSINWYAIPSQEAMDIVDTNQNGLTDEEAEKRRERFGANALPVKEPPGLISIFFRQFLNPLIYILVAAAIASTLIGKGRDALFIFAVLFFNASVGMYQ